MFDSTLGLCCCLCARRHTRPHLAPAPPNAYAPRLAAAASRRTLQRTAALTSPAAPFPGVVHWAPRFLQPPCTGRQMSGCMPAHKLSSLARCLHTRRSHPTCRTAAACMLTTGRWECTPRPLGVLRFCACHTRPPLPSPPQPTNACALRLSAAASRRTHCDALYLFRRPRSSRGAAHLPEPPGCARLQTALFDQLAQSLR